MKINKVSYICLAIGFIAATFTSGHYNIGIMAWIFPGMMLYVSRKYHSNSQIKIIKKYGGQLVVLVALMLSTGIRTTGCLMAGFPIDQIAGMLLSILYLPPFLIDKFVASRLNESNRMKDRILGTLVFPVTFAVMESIYNFIPFGYFLSLAMTQAENTAFLQLASLFGACGMSFAIAWIGSISLFAIDNFKKSSSRSFLCVVAAIYLAIFTFGFIRLETYDEWEDTTKIAYAGRPYTEFDGTEYDDLPISEAKKFMQSSVFEAYKAGAKLIVFPEEYFDATDENYLEIKNFVAAMAKENKIYILAGADLQRSNGRLGKNSCYMFDPNGGELFEYSKTILVPLIEKSYYEEGDGIVPTIDINFEGKTCKVSTAICFEGEFPRYFNTIDESTDIHLNPSWEWNGVCGFHTNTLILRAVEHGVSLVKPTYDGTSVVTDPVGRIINKQHVDGTDTEFLEFVEIPTSGVWTLYGAMKEIEK